MHKQSSLKPQNNFQFSIRTLVLWMLAAICIISIPRLGSFRQQVAANRLMSAGVKLGFNEPLAPQPLWSWIVFGSNRYSQVNYIRIANCSLNDSQISYLTCFLNSVVIELEHSPDTNKIVRAIRNKYESNSDRYLIELSISGEHFDQNGLNDLKDLACITLLNIKDANLHGNDLAVLSTMPNLEQLTLRGKWVNDNCVKHVSKCESLQYLGLLDTCATDRCLQDISGLRHLHSLYVEESPINGTGLVHLKGYRTLSRVSILDSPITQDSLNLILSTENNPVSYALYINSPLISDSYKSAYETMHPGAFVFRIRTDSE